MKTQFRAVLLGLFDGVHLGHAATCRALCKSGADIKTVYTFRSAELKTKGERRLILNDSEKEQKLLSLGADEVIFAPFAEVRDFSPAEFIQKVIINQLGADKVICGENFRFGKDALGDCDILRGLLAHEGIELEVVPTVTYDGEIVSTTRIRKLLEQGDIKAANRLLGYKYFLKGTVLHGDARGRKMGIRTINTSFDGQKILPPGGVYSSDVIIGGKRYMGVTNVGVRPTFYESGEIGIETHIIDFDGDVYSNTVSILFNKFYREEKKFSDAAALIETIKGDIERRKEESNE